MSLPPPRSSISLPPRPLARVGPPPRPAPVVSAPTQPVKKRKLSIREKAALGKQLKKEAEERVELSNQSLLFNLEEDWKKIWVGMPEFNQSDLTPFQSILVHFKSHEDRKAFSETIGQTVTPLTKSVWFPKAEIGRTFNKRYRSDGSYHPKYPIYIISKGRWESRLTQKSLEAMGVPYSVVIEPQEYDAYAAVMPPERLLVLPWSNHEQAHVAARNWVWEHSISIGAERHWCLDDNINGFYRLNNNLKVKVETGDTFRAAEDFVDRYENVALAGFNYFMFASRKTKMKPFTLNTRVYSMFLIKNDIPFRFRGKWNDDTDLSLRVLKAGWCTVLFNAFLGMKATTMTVKGGLATEYLDTSKDTRLESTNALKDMHPDVTTVTHKWGRWHHSVDYSSFEKNKLIPKGGRISVIDTVDNFGMELIETEANDEAAVAAEENQDNGEHEYVEDETQ